MGNLYKNSKNSEATLGIHDTLDKGEKRGTRYYISKVRLSNLHLVGWNTRQANSCFNGTQGVS